MPIIAARITNREPCAAAGQPFGDCRPDGGMSGDRVIYLEMGTMGPAAFPMQVVWQGNGLSAKDRFRLAPE